MKDFCLLELFSPYFKPFYVTKCYGIKLKRFSFTLIIFYLFILPNFLISFLEIKIMFLISNNP